MRLRHVIYLLAVITLTAAAQPVPREVRPPPTVEQMGTHANPLIVRIAPSAGADAEAAKQEERWKHHAHQEEILGTATIWLAIVTTALALFTAGLWFATYKLVSGAKDTAKRQLRAYIFFKPVLPIKVPTLDRWGTEGMRFMMHNNGQTPAYDVRQVTHVGLLVHDLNQILAPVEFDDGGSVLMLNPGMHSEQINRLGGPLSQPEIDSVRAGTHAIYVWGEIRYKDVFGDQHWCRYAFQITGEGEVPGNVTWCSRGNDAS